MTPEQKAAYVMAQAAAAEIEAAGMVAENLLAAKNQQTLPYREVSFKALIVKYDLHHNALVTFFHS